MDAAFALEVLDKAPYVTVSASSTTNKAKSSNMAVWNDEKGLINNYYAIKWGEYLEV